MSAEHQQAVEGADAQDTAAEPKKMSRREALAIVGKHAVYTVPVVMAVLKSGNAQASVF